MLDKRSLRTKMLNQRQALSNEERHKATVTWTAKARAFLAEKEYQNIAGYIPIKGELNVLPLLETLRAQGKTVLLPRTPESTTPLTFHRYHPNQLETGKYSIQQPLKSCETISPDILLVPLLAFDHKGHRLGYGGGYYDRTLANLSPRPLTIGCAYPFQQVEALEAEAHDIALDIVLI